MQKAEQNILIVDHGFYTRAAILFITVDKRRRKQKDNGTTIRKLLAPTVSAAA